MFGVKNFPKGESDMTVPFFSLVMIEVMRVRHTKFILFTLKNCIMIIVILRGDNFRFSIFLSVCTYNGIVTSNKGSAPGLCLLFAVGYAYFVRLRDEHIYVYN